MASEILDLLHWIVGSSYSYSYSYRYYYQYNSFLNLSSILHTVNIYVDNSCFNRVLVNTEYANPHALDLYSNYNIIHTGCTQ